MKQRGVGEYATEAVIRQIELEEILLPYFAPGMDEMRISSERRSAGAKMSDESRAYLVGKHAAEKSDSDKSQAENKRNGSIIITNDNRNIYPQAAHEERKKPNWVERGTLVVLFLTFAAALPP